MDVDSQFSNNIKPYNSMRVLGGYPLLGLNIALLVVALFLGKWLYGDTLGWGDALNFFSQPETAWGFFSNWYETQNGRLSQAVVFSLLKVLLRDHYAIPELFPWWAFRALSLFCMIAAPLNLAAVLLKILGKDRAPAVGLMLLLTWSAWSTSEISFATSAWFSAAAFVGYFLPIYLLSLSLLLWNGALDFKWNRNRVIVFGVLFGACYLFLSLLNEQLLASLPVLVIGMTLLKNPPSSSGRKTLFFVSLFFGLLTIVALLTYLTVPSQMLRNVALNVEPVEFSIIRILKWYWNSPVVGYKFLMQPVGKILANLVHAGILVVLIIGLKKSHQKKPGPDQKMSVVDRTQMYRLAVAGCTFHLAYLASISTKLVSPNYFPDYAAIYPALLLIYGLGIAILLSWKMACQKWDWLSQRLNFLVLFLLTMGVTISGYHSKQIFGLSDQAASHTKIRQNYYREIIERHVENGENNFILTKCPKYHGDEWAVDAPWGLVAYFTWRGYSSINVVVDNTPEFLVSPENKKYTQVECRI